MYVAAAFWQLKEKLSKFRVTFPIADIVGTILFNNF